MNQSYRVLTEAILERAITFARLNWQAMSQTKHPLVIEFHPEKARRSVQALRYYWQVLRQIEEQVWLDGRQYPADPIWDAYFKRRFIGVLDGPGGMTLAMHSSGLDAAEFAAYVTQVEAHATGELGVVFVDLDEPPWRM